MRSIITWSPDTCECCLEIECDDSLPPEDITWSLHGVVRRCAAHAAVADKEFLAEIFSENTRKNYSLGFVENIKGESVDKWLDKVSWSFVKSGKTRKLRLSITDLTAVQKTQFQTLCNQNFGAGKVEIV